MTRWVAGLTVGILTVLGCTPSQTPVATPTPASRSTPKLGLFEDRTAGSGIEFQYRNGEDTNHYTILESLGGGVALLDFDRDGKLDIFFTGGGYFEGAPTPHIRGYPSKLFRNQGNWKFEDVTASVGLDAPEFYSHGVAVGDFNCDGWPDLFLTGYGRVVLYQNVASATEPARRVFKNVTSQSGIPERLPWSSSAAFGDLNGDGYPELYVCQYLDWSFAKHKTCPHSNTVKDVCTPQGFDPLRSFLFQNNGNGTFLDVSAKQKLRADGKSLGVLVADLNGDTRPDIYVANDASENHLYLNSPGGALLECGKRNGADVDETGHVNGSMGLTVADWDRSGFPSLFVTNFQNEWHALYQNLGQARFQYRTQASGIAKLGQRYVGFGTAFADFDQDGWEDLIITNGHVLRHPNGSTLAQNPVLMKNSNVGSRRQFVEITSEAGDYFSLPHRGRGIAVGDLDNDGSLDVVVSHQNEPVVLLRNRSQDHPEQQRRSLTIQLLGRNRRDVTGSCVRLTVDGQTQSRYVARGGYLSSNSDVIHFGLGTGSKIEQIEVTWSFGKTQIWKAPLAGAEVMILREE